MVQLLSEEKGEEKRRGEERGRRKGMKKRRKREREESRKSLSKPQSRVAEEEPFSERVDGLRVMGEGRHKSGNHNPLKKTEGEKEEKEKPKEVSVLMIGAVGNNWKVKRRSKATYRSSKGAIEC
jgi:hypothetical protein